MDFYDDEDPTCESCPKCLRQFDEVDYDYQTCSKCGWDIENKVWTKPRKPTDADFLAGEADVLTGRWR